MKIYVLDANALYRFLHRGPGFEKVRDVLKDAIHFQTEVLMSVVNWGEVRYTMIRDYGMKNATISLRRVEELPLRILSVDMEQTRIASDLKAGYGLPYADCFAAALTGRNGILVTADTKDFAKVSWLKLEPLPPHQP